MYVWAFRALMSAWEMYIILIIHSFPLSRIVLVGHFSPASWIVPYFSSITNCPGWPLLSDIGNCPILFLCHALSRLATSLPPRELSQLTASFSCGDWSRWLVVILRHAFCFFFFFFRYCLKEKFKVFKYAKWPSKWLTNESLVWDLINKEKEKQNKTNKCLCWFLIDFIFCRLAETAVSDSLSVTWLSRKRRQSGESVRLPS